VVVVGEAGRDEGREEGWIGKGREIGDGESSLGREKVSSRLPPGKGRVGAGRAGVENLGRGQKAWHTKGDYYLDYYST
jgi:hypothetical protein